MKTVNDSILTLIYVTLLIVIIAPLAHADEQIEDYATGAKRRIIWDQPGRLGPIGYHSYSIRSSRSRVIASGAGRTSAANSSATGSSATIKPSGSLEGVIDSGNTTNSRRQILTARNNLTAAFPSYANPAFKDGAIRAAVGQLFALLEGTFGALIMVVAGIVAVIAAAMGSYKSAVSIAVVAIGAFILRALVSLFFGTNFGAVGVGASNEFNSRLTRTVTIAAPVANKRIQTPEVPREKPIRF